MRIVYEITPDDVVAANLLHFDHSPAMRWDRWIYRIAGVVVAFVVSASAFAFLQAYVGHFANGGGLVVPRPMPLVVLSFVVCLAGFILFPRYARGDIVRQVRKTLAQEQREGTATGAGTWTMEFVANRLCVEGPHAQTKYDLDAIKSIAEYDGYVLIHTIAITIHFIPIRNVLAGSDYREFIVALKDAWRNRDSQESIQDRSRNRPDDRITHGPK